MADDLTRRGGEDRRRINVKEAYELHYWAEKFGVSVELVREAVKAVGDRVENVEKYIKHEA
jgi:hypothetical protein